METIVLGAIVSYGKVNDSLGTGGWLQWQYLVQVDQVKKSVVKEGRKINEAKEWEFLDQEVVDR